MRIVLVSRNRYLWQKLRLLRSDDEVILAEQPENDFDKLVWDADTVSGAIPVGAVLISEKLGAALSPAFSEDELSLALGEGSQRRISIEKDTRTVTLDGNRIKLTEVEFALFSRLYESLGSYVPRGELILSVWGEVGNDSLINVYVHYLREKLERGAEKIIYSSRRLGYKLEVQQRI